MKEINTILLRFFDDLSIGKKEKVQNMAGNGSAGSVLGRAIGLVLTYVIMGALWGEATSFITTLGEGIGSIAQIGLYLFIGMLPFIVFAPELKDLI